MNAGLTLLLLLLVLLPLLTRADLPAAPLELEQDGGPEGLQAPPRCRSAPGRHPVALLRLPLPR